MTDSQVRVMTRCPIFRGVSAEEKAALAAASTERHFVAGAELFRAGELASVLYVLVHGRVKMTFRTPEGRTVVANLAGDCELCGWPTLLGEQNYSATAKAMEPVTALAWQRNEMERALTRIPMLTHNAFEILAGRLRDEHQRFMELTCERVPQRLARTLPRLSALSMQEGAQDCAPDIPLSRDELAQIIGTTRFTVSRLLNQWQGKGIVKASRGKVLVEKREALTRLAGTKDVDC